jgi:hypothetical protein
MLAADFAPARFDDREVGDGTALERARYFGGRFELASDPRGLLYATLANQTQIIGAGTYATSAQGSVIVHALRQLDIELLPQLTWSAGEYRFARQSFAPTDPFFYFGKLTANSVSATLRATYTFTPQLTLQAYGQAFLAIGHYDDVRQINQPAMGAPRDIVHLSDLAAAPAPTMTIPPPDFKDAAINVNVVFRWEYRLGSTIYFVYTHSQIPTVPVPQPNGFPNPTTLDPNAFRHGGTSDVFLLKFSSWWAS